MPAIWRGVLFIYNLLLLLLAVTFIIAATGRKEPLDFLSQALATPGNRIIIGAAAIVVVAVAIIVFIFIFKQESHKKTVVIRNALTGNISITIPAIKVLILRAVKPIEGLKEIRPVVKEGPEGLVIHLHLMINPELNIPETSQSIQSAVKQYLQETGGLQVAEVRVLVDDFSIININR